MPCALCNHDTELRRSHVLPKFAQRRLKAQGARIMRRDSKTDRAMPVQDFAFEPLLCHACEQSFSRWEDHAARTFNRDRFSDLPRSPTAAYVVTGLDYRMLKLYLLSVLWRMSVARSPAFRAVDLGPHEGTIGAMLRQGIPGSPTDYGCILTVVTDNGHRVPVTRPADRDRHDPLTVLYRLLLDGYLLTWSVGRSDASARCHLRDLFLQADGSWQVMARDFREIPFIREAIEHGMARLAT